MHTLYPQQTVSIFFLLNGLSIEATSMWKCHRICSIRCHGYYLFHHTILCSFYSRVATNRERYLLNSVLSVKSFVSVRALRKASFTKDYDAETWFWSKPSSFLISRHFATKRYLHSTSNPFPHFLLPMTSHVDLPLCIKNEDEFEENELALEDC